MRAEVADWHSLSYAVKKLGKYEAQEQESVPHEELSAN